VAQVVHHVVGWAVGAGEQVTDLLGFGNIHVELGGIRQVGNRFAQAGQAIAHVDAGVQRAADQDEDAGCLGRGHDSAPERRFC